MVTGRGSTICTTDRLCHGTCCQLLPAKPNPDEFILGEPAGTASLAVEHSQLGVTEEDAVHVLIYLFQPDLFDSEDFANENAALVLADVPALQSDALTQPT